MNSKNRGLPVGFSEDFKGLPVVKRIKILFIARKLLKLQREKKELFDDGKGGGRK